jgi:hypothetical protein
MVCLTLILVFWKGAWRRVFGDDVEEQRAPADHDIVVSERDGQLVLQQSDVNPVP